MAMEEVSLVTNLLEMLLHKTSIKCTCKNCGNDDFKRFMKKPNAEINQFKSITYFSVGRQREEQQ